MPLVLKQLNEEKLFLYSLVRMYCPGSVVEIGVSQGQSAVAIAMALRDNKKGRLTCVDNWSRKHGGKAGSERPALELLKENKIAGLGIVAFLTQDSQSYLKGLKTNSVDIVHVDGDHSVEGALADIRQALRVARQLVIVHDTNNLPSVHDACLQFKPLGGFFVEAQRGFWLCRP